MQERRTSFRSRTYLGGRITFHHRLYTIDCTIRDLSPYGARLELTGTDMLPGVFELTTNVKQTSRRAQIAWRNERNVGVRFQDTIVPANVLPLDLSLRIKKLERERDELKRRVAELSE